MYDEKLILWVAFVLSLMATMIYFGFIRGWRRLKEESGLKPQIELIGGNLTGINSGRFALYDDWFVINRKILHSKDLIRVDVYFIWNSAIQLYAVYEDSNGLPTRSGFTCGADKKKAILIVRKLHANLTGVPIKVPEALLDQSDDAR